MGKGGVNGVNTNVGLLIQDVEGWRCWWSRACLVG